MSSPVVRRWLVPVLAAVAVLAGGVAVRAVSTLARPELAPRSAEQLLAALQTARPDGLSGTIAIRSELGLPELPGFGGGQGALDLNTLLSGSHQLKVWYSSPDSMRLALIEQLSESSIITNGKDVWTWSSSNKTATHSVRPEGGRDKAGDKKRDFDTGALPVTPEQAAARVLEALGPSTSVTTSANARVAGRAAYELVLSPRDTDSQVSQVRLAIDSEHNVPLRVQIIPRGTTAPAFEVGFTSVDFARPDASWFNFTPPPGTKVTEKPVSTVAAPLAGPLAAAPLLAGNGGVTVGSGWTAVMVTRVPFGAGHTGRDDLSRMLRRLPRVDNGRVLSGSLFTAMLTDDGRLLVGAVSSAKLQAVSKDPAAQLKPTS